MSETDDLQERVLALQAAVSQLGKLLDQAVGELEAMARVYMRDPQEYIDKSPTLRALRNARDAILQTSLFEADGQDERV